MVLLSKDEIFPLQYKLYFFKRKYLLEKLKIIRNGIIKSLSPRNSDKILWTLFEEQDIFNKKKVADT